MHLEYHLLSIFKMPNTMFRLGTLIQSYKMECDDEFPHNLF